MIWKLYFIRNIIRYECKKTKKEVFFMGIVAYALISAGIVSTVIGAVNNGYPSKNALLISGGIFLGVGLLFLLGGGGNAII